MGRINYGHGMWDQKGLNTNVTYNGNVLKSWTAQSIPIEYEQL